MDRVATPLIECELCGARGASSVCTPALVGGEIMGSVLVVREQGEIADKDAEQIETTTSLAAPVLGNLRNLAIAETRAVTDALTGLAEQPRRDRDAQGHGRIRRTVGQTRSRAVLVDLDHFKKVNDNYGHQVGDEVLRRRPSRCARRFATATSSARYGGEEFLVLLQGTDKAEAANAAEKMRRQLASSASPASPRA